MKNNKLVNVVIVMIISFLILFVATETLAASNIIDITNTITSGNNTTNNSTGNNTVNNNVNNTTNNTVNNTTNNAVLTTNNTSNYNNTSLPDTGIEDSIPSVILVAVLGISAVYAYKKIQYYRDI